MFNGVYKSKNGNQWMQGVKKDMHKIEIIEGFIYNGSHFSSLIQHFKLFLGNEKKTININRRKKKTAK